MGFTALERIFLPERHRQRAAKAGFSIPAMQEILLGADAAPLLVTNMRGTFLPARCSASGFARYGFSECSIEGESSLIVEFHKVLSRLSAREGWSNRCTTIQEAISRLSEPKSLVISEAILAEVMGDEIGIEEARRLMAMRGYVAMLDGMQVVLSDLSEGAALVLASPKVTGFYTRVGEHLGVLAQRVDRAIMVVG